MTKIFVDSTEYIRLKYNFEFRSDFGRLVRHIKSIGGELISTEWTINEVKAHINKEVEVIYDTWEKGWKNAKKYKAFNGTSFSIIKSEVKKDDILNEALLYFENFLQNSQTKVYDNAKVDLNKIEDDYFKGESPFELKKDKKCEFPDAFAISIIVNETDLKKEKLIVITADKGFEKAVLKFNNISVYSTIGDYLGDVNSISNKDKFIYAYYSKVTNKNNIKDRIEEFIISDYSHVDINGLSIDRKGITEGYDYEEVEIESVAVSNVKVKNIKEIISNGMSRKAVVEFEFDITVVAICGYFDEEQSIWDSEEKDYIFRKYNFNKEEHKKSDVVEFSLEYDTEKEVMHYETVEEGYCLYLDDNTLIIRQ